MLKRSLLFLAPLLISNTAQACITYRGLTKSDVAFAEVMFEGEIAEYKAQTYVNPHTKRTQVRSVELVFNVENVLRGKLDQKTVSARWIHGTFGYPLDQGEFVERYGQKLRVALMMPTQAEKHCKRVLKFEKHTGLLIAIPSYGRCSAQFAGFGYVSGLDYKPMVLNGPCSGPYMINLDEGSNVDFGDLRFQNRLGILISDEVSFRFAQRHSELLDVEKFDDPDYQKRLIALGYDIVDELEAEMRAKWTFSESTPTEVEEFSRRYERNIILHLRRYATLFAEDPAYRDRIVNYDKFLEKSGP